MCFCRYRTGIPWTQHLTTKDGVAPLPNRVQAIQNFPAPTTWRKLREFLGLVNFYHRFISHCAHILQPLNNFQKETVETPTLHTLSNRSKMYWLVSLFTLTLYPSAPLSIMTNAFDRAVGAVLQQQIDGHLQPISYFSRKITLTEKIYSTFDKELLAIYLSIKHFQYGRTQVLYHDRP